MKYAITVAIMLSLSFGLITESFRYQSTAGIWEDDYDLLFDPARIPEIEGSRLWTSLSNFVTGYEEHFSNGSVPYILIGGSGNFGGYYPGLVFDNSSTKTPLYTGLDDPYGNEMYGDGELSEIDWIDTDGNGVFDERSVKTETRSAFDMDAERDFYIGVGRKLNDLRVGLGYMRKQFKNTFTDPNYNFTYDTTYENLNVGELTYAAHAAFGGDDISSTSENDIIFSVWNDRKNMSIGFTAEYDMISAKDEIIVLGDSTIYTDPSDSTREYTAVSILDSLTQPQSGNRIALELKTFYNYNENAQGRFYVGIFTYKLDYGDDAVAYYYSTREEISRDFLWDTTTIVTYYDGGKNRKGVRLGTKQLFDVTERLKFGLGFFYGMSSYFDSTTARDTTVAVEVYDDNDGKINDPDDYVATTWYGETWMTKRTGSINSFAIPVGVEFYLAKPLVFRLGAEHSLIYNDYTTVTNLIDYEPIRTRLVDGTGAVTETMIDPPSQPVGSEESDTETIPNTDYFYGIGWQVNNNLQIDLMGFSDLTDLSAWRLSATFKFD